MKILTEAVVSIPQQLSPPMVSSAGSVVNSGSEGGHPGAGDYRSRPSFGPPGSSVSVSGRALTPQTGLDNNEVAAGFGGSAGSDSRFGQQMNLAGGGGGSSEMDAVRAVRSKHVDDSVLSAAMQMVQQQHQVSPPTHLFLSSCFSHIHY